MAPSQPAGPRLHLRDRGLLAVATLRHRHMGRRAAAHRDTDPAVPGDTGAVRHPGGARPETAVDRAAGVRHPVCGIRPPVPGRGPHRLRHGGERGRPGAGARRAGDHRPQARPRVPLAGGGQRRARGRVRSDRGASGLRHPSDCGGVGRPGRVVGVDRLPASPGAGCGRRWGAPGGCRRGLCGAPGGVAPLPGRHAAGHQRVLPRRCGPRGRRPDHGPDGSRSA